MFESLINLNANTMNWKKITKSVLIFMTASTVLFGYLAVQNINQIYGGKTKKVDSDLFNPKVGDVCITNVNVLSEDGSRFLPNRTLCIVNGVIASIDSSTNIGATESVLDGQNKFLIPGLIDSHVHLFKSPNDLLLYIANGVTEIREMIGEPAHLQWREEIRQGRIGPDMYIASPRLGSFGTFEGFFMKWTQGFNNISNEKKAKQFVDHYASKGYDAVKVYSHLNKESYEALSRFAHEKGMEVVGHIPWSIDLQDVFQSQQSEIAHVEELMNAFRREFGRFRTQEKADEFLDYVDQRSREIAEDLVQNEVSVTTTVWLTQSFVRQKFELNDLLKEVELEYENPGISEWDERIPGGLGWLPHINRYKLSDDYTEEDKAWQKVFWYTYGYACQVILRNLYEGGVSILAGTDANLPPTVPGFSFHDELIAMREAGMSNVDILKSATVLPAQWMNSNTGIIGNGKKANLVLLDENPLEDIEHTQSIHTVFSNGKKYDRNVLDDLLEAVKEANNKSRTKSIDDFLD